MPLVTVQSNLPDDKFSDEFIKNFTAFVAETLSKPEERLTVNIEAGKRMFRGGSSDPYVLVHLAAVSVFEKAEDNASHSAKFFSFLQEQLGVSQDRINLVFQPLKPWEVGMAGTVLGMTHPK